MDRYDMWSINNLLPINHKLVSIKAILRRKRTAAVGTCHIFYLGQFFQRIEGERWLISKDP